jgi:pimeloyl-ACP methyl ester carboxylesterase
MYTSLMNTTNARSVSPVRHLNRPEGRVAYDVQGQGPLVVLVPGMGELRSTYRFLAPALVQAGYRVASTDLRGHGDSDTSFSSYGDPETAGDIQALIAELGAPAVVVGNSMGAGAAVVLAAEQPALVTGLVLVGPFVRDPPANAVMKVMFRVMMAPVWIAAMWKSYMPTLYAGQKPVDFEAYRTAVVESLKRPAYGKAFSQTTRQLTHAPAEARVADVKAPVLVVMGDRDPDFKDPAAEAQWVADVLRGEVVMVKDAGHYPHSQQPEVTRDAVVSFLSKVAPRG